MVHAHSGMAKSRICIFRMSGGTLWRALILGWQKLDVPSQNEWRTLLGSLTLAWQGVGFRSQNNVTNLLVLLHSRSRNLSMLTHSGWQNADLQNECQIPWRSFTRGRRSVLVYAQNKEANPLAFALSWLAESTFCNHKPSCTSCCAQSLPRPRWRTMAPRQSSLAYCSFVFPF